MCKQHEENDAGNRENRGSHQTTPKKRLPVSA
jgi:hypothetical protein